MQYSSCFFVLGLVSVHAQMGSSPSSQTADDRRNNNSSSIGTFPIAQYITRNISMYFWPQSFPDQCRLQSFCSNRQPGIYCYQPVSHSCPCRVQDCWSVDMVACPLGLVMHCDDGFVCDDGRRQWWNASNASNDQSSTIQLQSSLGNQTPTDGSFRVFPSCRAIDESTFNPNRNIAPCRLQGSLQRRAGSLGGSNQNQPSTAPLRLPIKTCRRLFPPLPTITLPCTLPTSTALPEKAISTEFSSNSNTEIPFPTESPPSESTFAESLTAPLTIYTTYYQTETASITAPVMTTAIPSPEMTTEAGEEEGAGDGSANALDLPR